jgi:hypothetical protein
VSEAQRLGCESHVTEADLPTCRCCGGKTVAMPVLRALSSLHPVELPHHQNWKAGQVHPAYLLISTSLDHRDPGARGGGWTDPDNLVTSCWPCNSGKAHFTLDELGWTLSPSRRSAATGPAPPTSTERCGRPPARPTGSLHDRRLGCDAAGDERPPRGQRTGGRLA